MISLIMCIICLSVRQYIIDESWRVDDKLEKALWADSTFLPALGVMDYSLLMGIDTASGLLVGGIIDSVRQVWRRLSDKCEDVVAMVTLHDAVVVVPVDAFLRSDQSAELFHLIKLRCLVSYEVMPGHSTIRHDKIHYGSKRSYGSLRVDSTDRRRQT
jgi:hypothetical protein